MTDEPILYVYGLSTDGGQTYNPHYPDYLTKEEAQEVCDKLNVSDAWKRSKKRPHFTPVLLHRDSDEHNCWEVA